MITQAQIDSLKARAVTLAGEVNALVATSAPAPSPAPVPAPAPAEATLWTTQTPAVDGGVDNGVTIGTRFRTNAAGQILGVRFWKYAGNTGVHIANLWSNTGAKLASATFGPESASGWQEIRFATPVSVVAGVDYVVSYQCLSGHYAFTTNYFASAYTRGALTASAGLYKYGTSPGFPTLTWQNGCYWVDAIFKAA